MIRGEVHDSAFSPVFTLCSGDYRVDIANPGRDAGRGPSLYGDISPVGSHGDFVGVGIANLDLKRCDLLSVFCPQNVGPPIALYNEYAGAVGGHFDRQNIPGRP